MRQVIFLSLLFCVAGAQAAPLVFNWSGTIVNVVDDTGTTFFTGTQVDDAFSGSFVYDSTPGTVIVDDEQACDASLCEWLWDGPGNVGTLAGGPGPVGGVFLIQENDQDLSENPGDLDLINSILDPDITVNTAFDIWELSVDLQTADGLAFIGVTLLTTDTGTITDASVFQSLPPFGATPAMGRAAAFALQHEATTGTFFALGLLDSMTVTTVPVPGAALLFASALGLLRRRRARR